MNYLSRDVFRLAATYLAIMMVMSIIFSGLLYGISSQEIGRRPRNVPGEIRMGGGNLQQFFEEREHDIRQSLLVNLLLANLTIFIVGALISYLLAERTLRPIEENMAAQAQFISDASHELRTPLTSLLAANEVALRNKKLTLKAAREVIEENVTDTIRLQKLADSLLGLLKQDEQPSTELVDMQVIAREALRVVEGAASNKNIRIVDDTAPVTCLGNTTSLTQLCTILLDNAVKYSHADSMVSISTQLRGKQLHLTVKDEGIGMDEATKKQIFSRFFRGEDSRTTKGYGLGLSIAAKIVKQHNGTITVQSTPGEGSIFTVCLPANNVANE